MGTDTTDDLDITYVATESSQQQAPTTQLAQDS